MGSLSDNPGRRVDLSRHNDTNSENSVVSVAGFKVSDKTVNNLNHVIDCLVGADWLIVEMFFRVNDGSVEGNGLDLEIVDLRVH